MDINSILSQISQSIENPNETTALGFDLMSGGYYGKRQDDLQKRLLQQAQTQSLQSETRESERKSVAMQQLPTILQNAQAQGMRADELLDVLLPIVGPDEAFQYAKAYKEVTEAETQKPQSKEGKLKADLDAGLIDQEQYDLASGGKRGDALKKVAIPGYDLDPDVMPDPATARGARELATTIPSFENAITKVNKLIDKYGSTTGFGSDVNDVDQAFADLMNAERSLNNTGVLNVGELPILEKNYQSFDPRNKINLMKSKEEMKASALSYLNDRRGILNAKLKSIGYHQKAGALDNVSSGAGAPKVGVVEDGYRFKGGDPANPESWEAM